MAGTYAKLHGCKFCEKLNRSGGVRERGGCVGRACAKVAGSVPRPVLEDAYCDQIEIGARPVQGSPLAVIITTPRNQLAQMKVICATLA